MQLQELSLDSVKALRCMNMPPPAARPQRPAYPPQPQPDAIVASVIVPSFNSKLTIRATLQAILTQKTSYPFEVIVVDSSNDGTAELVGREFPAVRLFRLHQQVYPGSGRNLGVQRALGRYVVFTDSDCVPASDWLERIVASIRTRDTDAVGGCVVNGYPKRLTGWVSHLIEFNEWTENTPAGQVKNIPTCNIAYRRQIFFERHLSFTDIFPSEDTIFNWILTERGGRIYFDPGIRVVHFGRVGLRRLLRHQFTLGQASAEARRTTTLPGQLFVRYPILSLLLPGIRWLRTFWRLLKNDRKQCALFVGITPLYLTAVFAWSVGFMWKRPFGPAAITVESGGASIN